jgi:predicted  nucleic acid-binding Zn-ribbon protein
MSAIGRIFVILNLVLAAAFVGWAATSLAKGSEWMKQYDTEKAAHEATKAELQKQLDDRQNTLNAERTQKDKFREERDGFQSERDRLTKDLEEARRANDQLRGDVSKIQETLGAYNSTIAQITAAKDAAVQKQMDLTSERDAAKADSEKAMLAQRDAQDGLKTAQAQIADLERNYTSAKEDISHKEAIIAQATAQGMDLTGQAMPAISGRVLQVNSDLNPGLVMLNVGSEQGVKRGFTFQVYSGSTWKGQVRVENVQANMCSAVVLDLQKGQKIAQGDNAATHL